MIVGFSVISFAVYLATVILFMTLLKKSIITSLFTGWVVLLILTGSNFVNAAIDSITYSFTQENEYALIMFGIMGFLMEATGMVNRIVNILNSLFGRFRGGSGFVNVLGSAVYGVCSGSVMGASATIGAVTIPWMKESGFSTQDASVTSCANSGLAIMVPPSTCFAIILSWPIFVSMGYSSGTLYLENILFGAYLVILRLIQCGYVIKRAKIGKPDASKIPPILPTLQKNWTGLLLFVATILPVLVTTGPLNAWLKGISSWGKSGNKAVSLMTWLPMCIILMILAEGWKYLPHDFKGICNLVGSSIDRFKELGSTLLLGYFAARVLSNMGLAKEMGELFSSLPVHNLLLIFIISLILFMSAGPLSPTVIMNSIGPIAFSGLMAAGVNPYVACMGILGFSGMGSCIPPSTPALYVTGGIAGLEDVKACFSDLIFLYAIPSFLLIYLYMIGFLPSLAR